MSLAVLYVIVTVTSLGEVVFAAFWVKILMLIASVIVLAFWLVAAVLVSRKKIS
jgi:hypothetical protein